MPEPAPGQIPDPGRPGDRRAARPGAAGTPGSAGPGDGSASPPASGASPPDSGTGLAGIVDLSDLQGVLDAARASDEEAGDPLGEDAITASSSGAGRAWPAAEVAGTAAEFMAPGPGLASWAACMAPEQMNDYTLAGAAAACRRLASWAQAAELAIVAEVAARAAVRDSSVPAGPGGMPGQVPEEAAAEIALALRMSQYGASCWTHLAITLTGRLPGTAAALRGGVIDLTRARLIAEATNVLDDAGARRVEDKILPAAGDKTAAQLRAALRRAVITIDPAAAERRREQAERRAKVGLYGDEDGTATLSGQNLPGAHAAAAMARVTALARALKASGAGGGIDLLRAQVYLGLLLGTLPLIPPPEHGPPDKPDEPDHPGDHGGPGRRPDPDGPSSPDPDDPGPAGPSDPENQGDGPEDPAEPGEPEVPEVPYDPGDRKNPDEPEVPCDPGDRKNPDEPVKLRVSRHPGDPAGDAAASRPLVLPWPGLPVPGQVPAGLAPSGTGALAGLPRGPATTALLHLTVPWRTLAGTSALPGQLTRLGPVTPQTARHLAETAATDHATEWKVIVTDSRGRAIAVTRIRRSPARATGSTPQPAGLVSAVTLVVPGDLARGGPSEASPGQAAALSAAPSAAGALGKILAKALGLAARAAARADADADGDGDGHGDGHGGCTHRQASPAYRPPPRLREFVAARDQTCRFPPCRQPADRADLDHTVPYDQGGRTCSCNLGGGCRTHHRIKQRPGWQLIQPQPGTFQWVTPAGRAYVVTPDTYEA